MVNVTQLLLALVRRRPGEVEGGPADAAQNAALLGVLLLRVESAAREFAPVRHVASSPVVARTLALAERLSGADVALVDGSLPGLLTDLVESDWNQLGVDVESLASSVVGATDGSGDSAVAGVARYASLVRSVAERVAQLPTEESPSTSMRAGTGTGEGGLLLQPLSYAVRWARAQADSAAWGEASKACDAFVAAAQNVNWSGSYSANGERYKWDVNEKVQDGLTTAGDVCGALSSLSDS